MPGPVIFTFEASVAATVNGLPGTCLPANFTSTLYFPTSLGKYEKSSTYGADFVFSTGSLPLGPVTATVTSPAPASFDLTLIGAGSCTRTPCGATPRPVVMHLVGSVGGSTCTRKRLPGI